MISSTVKTMEMETTYTWAQTTVCLARSGLPAPRFCPTRTPEARPRPPLPRCARFSARRVREKAARDSVPNCATSPTTTSCAMERSMPVTEAGRPILTNLLIIRKSG